MKLEDIDARMAVLDQLRSIQEPAVAEIDAKIDQAQAVLASLKEQKRPRAVALSATIVEHNDLQVKRARLTGGKPVVAAVGGVQ